LGILDTKDYNNWQERNNLYINNNMSDNLITTDDLNGIEKAKLMEIINDIKTGNILTMSISISWNIYLTMSISL
jgi:hypothetical protein